jgi:hypothetical protein
MDILSRQYPSKSQLQSTRRDPPGLEFLSNANSLLRGRLLADYAGLRRYSLQFVQVKALFERWEHPVSDELPHGRSRYRHHGCRCAVCKEANRLYMRELRARKRGLTPVPADVTPTVAEAAGRVVAAVEADLAALGDLTRYRALAAAAVAMGRILDDPRQVTTQPSAAKQLTSLLEVLRREAPPRPGRLRAVQAMTDRA